jgi:hypothetical protein
MIPESYMEWPAQSKGEDPTDDGPPGAIQAYGHWRHLQASVAPPRREDGIFMFTEKLLCARNIHRHPPALGDSALGWTATLSALLG